LILALGLSLLAAWPFVLRASLPRETDAELHVFRAAELGYALRAGALYPRWAPDFYYGYGYPIFNYYAPLTYYLANLLSLLIPGAIVFGVRAVFVLGFLCAGLGTYGAGHRLWGARGGLIAAACYLFAPYVHYVDPHARGDLAEFFALGLGPLALWALMALRDEPGRARVIVTSLLVAGLIASHNLLALVFFGLFLAWTAWTSVADALASRLNVAGAAARFAPLVLGVGLAAFFWLPVWLERNQVQLGNLIGPGHFDYRTHFLTPGELLAPSLPLDFGAVNPAFRLNLGLAQWALALVAILLLVRRPKGRRYKRPVASGFSPPKTGSVEAGFFLIATLALIGLMMPVSVTVWDALPVMAFLQFPWRLLGPTALCASLLAGGAMPVLDGLLPSWMRAVALVCGLALPLVLALPLAVPLNWGDFGPTDQLAILDFELHGLALGTTSTGDFLPIEVEGIPGPQPELIESYRSGGPVDKVNRYTLPDGALVEVLEHGPTHDRFSVESPEPFVLRLYTFMFAGWRATVDGEPVGIEIGRPEGFITVPVPAGRHVVEVRLGDTPPRRLSWAISGASLAAIIGLAALRRGSRIKAQSSQDNLTGRDFRIGGLTLAGFAALVALSGLIGLGHIRSTGIVARPAEHDLHATLLGGIDLLGYDTPLTRVRPGEELPLTLYWKARQPITANAQVFVHLVTDGQVHTWGQSDKLNPGDYPTTRWPTDRYVRDPHRLTVYPGTPPGEYSLNVGLWDRATGARWLVIGDEVADHIRLPVRVTVLPPDSPPDPASLPLDVRLDKTLAPGMELLGVQRVSGPALTPPGYVHLALYWRSEAEALPEYVVRVRLLDSDGSERGLVENAPAGGRYPTGLWSRGEVVRDPYAFWLDETAPPGAYTAQVSLDGQTWVKLTGVEVGQSGDGPASP
jgi:hypothetical protein